TFPWNCNGHWCMIPSKWSLSMTQKQPSGSDVPIGARGCILIQKKYSGNLTSCVELLKKRRDFDQLLIWQVIIETNLKLVSVAVRIKYGHHPQLQPDSLMNGVPQPSIKPDLVKKIVLCVEKNLIVGRKV